MTDRNLTVKGSREPLAKLMAQAKASVELAGRYADALAECGWSMEKTEQLKAAVSEVEVQVSEAGDSRVDAKTGTEAERGAVAESKAFIDRLRTAAPMAARGVKKLAAHVKAIQGGGTLKNVTGKISAYLTKVRPSVAALDEKLAQYFKGQKASEQLDKIKAELDSADATQEALRKQTPAKTASVNEAKGTVAQMIGDLGRVAKLAFSDRPEVLAQFNRDILKRGGKRNGKDEEPKPEPAPAPHA